MKAVDYIRKGWTRREWARDCHGRQCAPASHAAVRWCIEGALWMAYGEGREFADAAEKLRKVIGVVCLVYWNDRRATRQQVIEAMEKAGV